ncbi:hypothetical protein GOZ94_23960 [Agrobacterium vitis]|nr:hypothetical protein [Agrobacterium vitis]MVA21998.1 hypothetical protein [Agrobacterium vitis]
MRHFLKSGPHHIKSSAAQAAPQKVSLDFSSLEQEFPDLWVRVVIIRSRVKQLSFNFDRDAQTALKWFHALTGGTAVLTILALCVAFRLAPAEGNVVLAVTVVLAGTVAAILASAANALGAGQRASSMFAAKWSMRALELRIDQTVHMIAIEATSGKLTPALVAKLDSSIEAWLGAVTQTLSSFGSEYGKALGTVTVPEPKLPDFN